MPCDKLLIFDLDETLIHTSLSQLDRPAYFMFETYHVYQRPFAEEMIRVLGEHFDMAVWSAGSEDYVNVIVARIFPALENLKFVWSRSRCRMQMDPETMEEVAVKNLRKVKQPGHPLEKILIVEDTMANVSRNYGNAIYVKPFDGSEVDDELRRLCKYLMSIKDVPDVRKIDKRGWRGAGH